MVTIITPTYNRAHLIAKCINSVQSQSFQDWEHLIIDDHSTDKTKDLIEEYGIKDERIKYLLNPKKGAPSARNYGIQNANGDYLLFLDSDDEITEQKLLKHMQLFNESVDVTVSKVVRFKRNKKIKIDNIQPTKNLLVEFIRKDIAWKIHAPIWRKQFIIDNNIWFDESLKNSQDYQFYSYCVINQPRVKYVHEYLSIINDYDKINDPSKIRGQNVQQGLKHNILSRKLIKRYLKNFNLSLRDQLAIQLYFTKHKIRITKKIFEISFKW